VERWSNTLDQWYQVTVIPPLKFRGKTEPVSIYKLEGRPEPQTAPV
jgi:hypothetical protein